MSPSLNVRTHQLLAMICPSILNADLANLTSECVDLLKSGSDRLHLDVMDGHFVPNLIFGPPLVKSLRKNLGTGPFFDVHMMVTDPAMWVEPMREAGANLYTFHLEAVDRNEGVGKMVRKIREANMQVGLAIKPGTDVSEMIPFCNDLDMALIMTVEPGFGGQKFMADMMPKVLRLRTEFPNLNIQVDGGVGPSNIDICAENGANVIVSGSALVNDPDRANAIRIMRDSVDKQLNRDPLNGACNGV